MVSDAKWYLKPGTSFGREGAEQWDPDICQEAKRSPLQVVRGIAHPGKSCNDVPV